MALCFDCRRFSAMGYSCIGLCRSGRFVACCGSSAVLPVFGSVWRFKPFCHVGRSGIPLKRSGLYMGKTKPLCGVSSCGMLCSCSVFPVVPFPVLRSVWSCGMVVGGKAVPVVIGYGWRLAVVVA